MHSYRICAFQVLGTGSFADKDESPLGSAKQKLSEEDIERYFSNELTDGSSCAARVLEARRRAEESGKERSLGVESTVGLGAALLIFIFVGVFAAGIAQAFQLVRFIVLR